MSSTINKSPTEVEKEYNTNENNIPSSSSLPLSPTSQTTPTTTTTTTNINTNINNNNNGQYNANPPTKRTLEQSNLTSPPQSNNNINNNIDINKKIKISKPGRLSIAEEDFIANAFRNVPDQQLNSELRRMKRKFIVRKQQRFCGVDNFDIDSRVQELLLVPKKNFKLTNYFEKDEIPYFPLPKTSDVNNNNNTNTNTNNFQPQPGRPIEEIEKERIEKERIEKERLEKEKEEKLRLEKEEKERKRKERKEKKEREKLEAERLEKERLEKERIEKEKKRQERRERKEKEKEEKERLERERIENERLEFERLERERLERERLESERIERERLENERLEHERLERERIERERLEREKLERENLERLEKDRQERERREKERKDKIRQERIRLEKLKQEKLEKEKEILEKLKLESNPQTALFKFYHWAKNSNKKHQKHFKKPFQPLSELLYGKRQQLDPYVSPHTTRELKPYIRRDYETCPPKLQQLRELHQFFKINNLEPIQTKSTIISLADCQEVYPIDYKYLTPELANRTNQFLSDHFWPGVNVDDILEYPDFTVCALYRSMIIGCGLMNPDGYIMFISVHPEWQGCGIASFMLYHLTQTMIGKDITLHVSTNNSALTLYQKFGFKPEEFINNFYDKYYTDESGKSKNAYLLRLRR